MENVLRLENVSKRYQHFELKNIDLSLQQGEVLGLVGVNGAGKSTTLRIMMGLIAADSGTVNVLGMNQPECQVQIKKQVGFASDDMSLYKQKNLRWHMDFVKRYFHSWDEPYAMELAKKFDINTEQELKGFSHGQRVKANLLLSLAHRPKLVVLDEPTTGLDAVARREVLEELSAILRDEQRSVVFSSHNTQDVELLSDNIAFLHGGEVFATNDKESFIDQWRKIRCIGNVDIETMSFAGIVNVARNGSLYEILLNPYNTGDEKYLEDYGLQIQSIENMTLEDIFVSSVRYGVKQ